jgi:phage gpG-like protein
MADAISITVTGSAELRAALQRLQGGVERPRELLERIGVVLEGNVQERLQTKADPLGRAWMPLAASTRARYAKADGKARQGSLLVRTGLMLASLSSSVSGSSVTVGFARPYALYHETGTKRGGVLWMPRRGMLTADAVAGTLGPQDEADLLAAIDRWLGELA